MESKPFNKALVYDDDCPLCKAYTSAFVNTGFLSGENRVSFSNIEQNSPTHIELSKVDWHKAKHEIPLVDVVTGEVKYGVDALVDILAQKLPFVSRLMKVTFVRLFFVKLYKLISYNRRIIVAGRKAEGHLIDYSPDYHFGWRWTLVLITLLLSLFTSHAAITIGGYQPGWHFASFALLLICVLPFLTAFTKSKEVRTDVYAHTGLVCVITSFMFLLIVVTQKLLHYSNLFTVMCSAIALYVIVRQVIQRVHFMKQAS